MLIQETEIDCRIQPVRIQNRENTPRPPLQLEDALAASESTSFRLFEQNSPLSLAEQFPRLLILAVAAAILLTAITAEIDCLRGAGYYWP